MDWVSGRAKWSPQSLTEYVQDGIYERHAKVVDVEDSLVPVRWGKGGESWTVTARHQCRRWTLFSPALLTTTSSRQSQYVQL